MNTRVGLGVFGTFGEPNGFQQVFYNDVNFEGSLDLNEDEIEFYPGDDLYAVRREMIDGVYSVCFCIYSYVRELNTERFGTFLGTTIVLQEGYAEADYIYRALRNLNDSVLANSANVDNNILVATQAPDIVIRESEYLMALRANTIPISKTPFFSAAVHEGRRFFVTPNPLSEDPRERQIINFFEKALKDYNDTDSLFFSSDRGVYEFVAKNRALEVTDWDEFMEYRSEAPAEVVVLTKKGIHKPPPGFATENKEETIKTPEQKTGEVSTTSERYESQSVAETNSDIYEEEDEDPFKPFNLWDEPVPPRGWNQDEAKTRVKEYNRLFRYTNTLLEHINETTGESEQKRLKRRKEKTEKPALEEATADEFTEEKEKKKRKRPPFWMVLAGVVVVGGAALFLLKDDEDAAAPASVRIAETPASVQDPEIEESPASPPTADTLHTDTPTVKAPKPEEEIAPMQPIARVTAPPTVTVSNVAPSHTPGQEAPPVPAKTAPLLGTVGSQPETPARNPLMLKESAVYQKAKDLHPRPNMEMMQTDIAIFKEIGVKNKTLSELTKMLFDNVPSNIGNIYKGQELEYCAALLSSNRQSFKLYGSEYVCINDAVALRIPAYKSPRLPAVYPK